MICNSGWVRRNDPHSHHDRDPLILLKTHCWGVRMLRQFLIGAAVSICNIAIHAMVMVAVINVARIARESATSRQSFQLIAVMNATASVLMVAHLVEVLV
jgi:hypothetical protein